MSFRSIIRTFYISHNSLGQVLFAMRQLVLPHKSNDIFIQYEKKMLPSCRKGHKPKTYYKIFIVQYYAIPVLAIKLQSDT